MPHKRSAFLTVAEVAEALDLSDETVHRWCRQGRLEYVQIGRGKRFRRAYIDELISRGTVPARVRPETTAAPATAGARRSRSGRGGARRQRVGG